MAFTHLHVHTEYSLLDGSSKIGEIVRHAKDLGQDALAITDHGVMYGVIDFYKKCLEVGIKPIIGCEVYVAPGSRLEKEGSTSDDRYRHLILLAKDNDGYKNLMKIVSRGFTEGFYYKPRVDLELLREFHEGIIALSACLAGEIPYYLRRGLYDEGKEAALRMLEIFGEGNFYLELQDHGIPEQALVNEQLVRMSNETGIPLVATNDVHYTYAEDAQPHDVLLCIQTQRKVSDTDRMRYEGGQFYLKSEEEMRKLFPYAPEAIENTAKVAEKCNVTFKFNEYKLPHFDVPEGFTPFSYLESLCKKGLKERYGKETPEKYAELEERLRFELETISNMGFVDYFLIVWDFIHFARENGIAVGPGRGSAAGSVVAYTLGITNIDPIRFSLFFERFLNPERVTMPDIDIDFCYERRPEVIDYVNRKYGHDRVVQIVTFGTLAARGVIRDVGRAMDMTYAQTDRIAKMIPMELNMTLDKALEVNSQLRNAYETEEDVHSLIDTSKRLEGLPRHTSIHAAGVVIAPAPAEEFVPLSRSSDGTITTQYTMTTLEELGLLKMDFLGLRTLTVIQDTVRAVNAKYPEKKLDINEIDLSDPNIYELISQGRTEGVFQLESRGMTSFMKELAPSCIEDIIAGIALYRPGPMDFIPKYLKGKRDPEAVVYDCEELRPILSPTYGCIVYQEQVMQIVRDLAGYSFGRSDLVRRAMSKKKQSVMDKERANFVYGNEAEGVPGCKAKGISEEVANKIFDDMIDFAKYAFNKAHAAAYAVVAMQTAYLKCYYPVEFMASLLTSVTDNSDKVAGYIFICRKMGIKLLPPDVNEGGNCFTACGGDIRYSLSAIKGLGGAVVDVIVADRESNGPYKSLRDFMERLSSKESNKRVIESLIKAGALDCLPGSRRQKMVVYSDVLEGVALEKKKSVTGQISMFDLGDENISREAGEIFPDVPEYDVQEKLDFEKEVLGIYVSGHPLDAYKDILDKNVTATSLDFIVDEETGETVVADKQRVVIGGIVSARSVKTTRSGLIMAFITVEDMYGKVEVIVFPKDFEKRGDRLLEDTKILISGNVSVDEERGATLLFSDCVELTSYPRTLWVKFDDEQSFENEKGFLEQELADRLGPDRCMIYIKNVGKKILLDDEGTKATPQLLKKLKEKLGEENVTVSVGTYWKDKKRQ
ncbi:MAG: DNA polymerase III subunit alpha [Lachnospiraceae bacterium]|nr:DNA polymerase III subunit alpha [Lachnospiraceae bacterium]